MKNIRKMAKKSKQQLVIEVYDKANDQLKKSQAAYDKVKVAYNDILDKLDEAHVVLKQARLNFNDTRALMQEEALEQKLAKWDLKQK